MTWVSPLTVKADKVVNINGVTTNVYLLKDHNVNNIALPSKRTNRFKGVVIHNTDRVKSEDDGRQYTAATLNNNVATRTHFYITEKSAWQNLEMSDMNWSCGDGTKGEGNNGCISLEIIMQTKNLTVDLQSRENGAKIAAYILYKNKMTVNDMYTHNYFLNIRNGVEGDYETLCTTPTPTRNCPYYIVWDWENFRRQVDTYIKQLGGESVYDNIPSKGAEVQYIFQATSQAAIRADKSKNAKILGRVTRGDYYCADTLYPNKKNSVWFKHAGQNAYSMLYDGGSLFTKVGEYVVMRTTAKINLRQEPGLSSKVLGTLSRTTIVYVWSGSAVSADGYDWVKVIIEGKIGYVAVKYLK